MAPNLHPAVAACVLLAGVTLSAGPAPAPPCPPEAGRLVAAGWEAYRADSIATALERFTRSDRLCADNFDAKIGLGYVMLRQDRLEAAESLFTLVAARHSTSGDVWDGLTLVYWRRGDRAGADSAARRAIALHPDNATTRGILDRLDPDWSRPPLAAPRRPAALRVDARTRGDFFEVPDHAGRWRQFYVKGVNLGVALPGRFPSEFPPDSATYAGWLDTLATMHANTLRLYTILPPAFYRALGGWNRSHPDRAFRLIHGVWTELPPNDDFNDSIWRAGFRREMRRVVDLVHGAAEIPVRPGHAGGRYDTDVSRWVLGYIIGREWEPYAVKEFDARHPASRPWRGRFLAAVANAPAADRWMAEECDYLLAYEVDRYNTIRPIAYTNWPTLDPLTHPTESSSEEERAWRRKLGRELRREPIEYENDVIGLDAMLVRPTARNPAGWFASYHAYPYYPDFMLYDPGYHGARSSEGRSNYFGYLTELKRHHAGVPLLIAEYGVPSSRGLAHLQPQGWHHGGHDETAMARIDARLTREIRESGAAGAVLFAWIDEWFKKNWIVIDYEIPRENTRHWHNRMDAEQNYGILGMYAGDGVTTPAPGGDPARWRGLAPLLEDPDAAAGHPARIRAGSDESYFYIGVEFTGAAGQAFPGGPLLIALDSYRPGLGQHTLPDSLLASDIGFEFLAVFRDTTDAELRVTPDYNPYHGAEAIVSGDDSGKFARRPVTTVSRADGRFDSMFVITNRTRITRDGRLIPASGYNRGRLRFGRAAESSLSDWYWDRSAGMLQLRLPWGLIGVSDPSSRTLLFDTTGAGEIGTAQSDGFRLGVALAREGRVVAALPRLDNAGRWAADRFPTWQWQPWTEPRYHQRLKPVYDSLKALWGTR